VSAPPAYLPVHIAWPRGQLSSLAYRTAVTFGRPQRNQHRSSCSSFQMLKLLFEIGFSKRPRSPTPQSSRESAAHCSTNFQPIANSRYLIHNPDFHRASAPSLTDRSYDCMNPTIYVAGHRARHYACPRTKHRIRPNAIIILIPPRRYVTCRDCPQR